MTQPLLLFGSLFDCWMSASLTGAISAESSFFFSFCKFNNFLFLTSCPPYKCKNKRKTMEPARSWTRLSSRESARAAYIGRTALVPICQCPRQEMSLLKIVCNWGGGGNLDNVRVAKTQTISKSDIVWVTPLPANYFFNFDIVHLTQYPTWNRVMQTIVWGYLGQIRQYLSCPSYPDSDNV